MSSVPYEQRYIVTNFMPLIDNANLRYISNNQALTTRGIGYNIQLGKP